MLSVLAAGAGRGAAVAFCVPLVVGSGHLLVPLFASMQSDMFGEAWRAYSKGAEKEYAAFKVRLCIASVSAAGCDGAFVAAR